MVNSRSKGKRGELEVANILKEHGYDARRGQQYCGANGDADVVGLDDIHLEVKRTEKSEIYKWMDQASDDANEREMPVIVHRKDRKPWVAIMDFEDFIKMYDMVQALKEDRGL